MKRLIVGISGASAAIYGIRLLEVLRETDVETHLVISSAAKKIILMETDFMVEEVEMMADHVYECLSLSAKASVPYINANMPISLMHVRPTHCVDGCAKHDWDFMRPQLRRTEHVTHHDFEAHHENEHYTEPRDDLACPLADCVSYPQ